MMVVRLVDRTWYMFHCCLKLAMIIGIWCLTSFQCVVFILSSFSLGDIVLLSMSVWRWAFLYVPSVDMYKSHAIVSASACFA